MTDFKAHVSVLLNECVDAITSAPSQSPFAADLTFGRGGHTFEIAAKSSLQVFCTDQDPEAFQNGLQLIKDKNLENRIHLNKMNFSQFPEWFKKNHPDKKLKGILLDLGVSSHQFDADYRGFSFRLDGPLDMRMDIADDSIPTAHFIVNTYAESDIADILFHFGEERLSRRIARNICEYRVKKSIETTKELEEIVFTSYPASQRHGRTHPATRTFQALRIYVNKEIEVLENVLEGLYEILDQNGRLAIITFHSLEDRIVKHKFKDIFARDKNAAKILTKKPIYPSDDEVRDNPRSRSAKLRIIEKN